MMSKAFKVFITYKITDLFEEMKKCILKNREKAANKKKKKDEHYVERRRINEIARIQSLSR